MRATEWAVNGLAGSSDHPPGLISVTRFMPAAAVHAGPSPRAFRSLTAFGGCTTARRRSVDPTRLAWPLPSVSSSRSTSRPNYHSGRPA